MSELHIPKHPVRLVTASSLFDGHDASINIMRRIFMSQGCEVVHLGHNRSVQEVVDAAIEEDVQGIAVSSYQGGHIEYFEYLVESLRERGADHVHVVGGGGGVIVHDEIDRLRSSGVTIFSPEDGQRLGLPGMINSVVADLDFDLWDTRQVTADDVISGDRVAIARAITGVEEGKLPQGALDALTQAAAKHWFRCSASPAPAAPASPASPTSSYAGSASTSRTSCASRWSRWTRPGAGAAARCSATGSG